MKIIILLAIVAALFLTSCTYRVQFGKACTPGHSEWSYVWLKEKGENKYPKFIKFNGNKIRRVP